MAGHDGPLTVERGADEVPAFRPGDERPDDGQDVAGARDGERAVGRKEVVLDVCETAEREQDGRLSAGDTLAADTARRGTDR